MTEVYLDPSWVIVGAEHPDNQPDRRVTVIASQKLTRAELRRRFEHADLFSWPTGNQDRVDMPPVWDLTMVLGDVYLAVGATYAEALQRLFAAWSPDVREAVSSPRTSGRSDPPLPRPLNFRNPWPDR